MLQICPIIAYSTPHRKTLNWYIKLAIELLLNTSVTNALLFYKLTTNRKIKISDFRMELAIHLTRCRSTKPLNISILRRLRHEMREGRASIPSSKILQCYQKNFASFGTKITHLFRLKIGPKRLPHTAQIVPTSHIYHLKCFNTIHQ